MTEMALELAHQRAAALRAAATRRDRSRSDRTRLDLRWGGWPRRRPRTVPEPTCRRAAAAAARVA